MVDKNISRRDFLKFTGISIAGLFVAQFLPRKRRRKNKMIAFMSQSSSGYKSALSTYQWTQTAGTTDPKLLLGMVVAVSIFGSGTVTSVRAKTATGDWRDFTQALSVNNTTSVRSDVWTLNDTLPEDYTIEVNLSGSLNSAAGAHTYRNFVSVGEIIGAIATGDTAQFDIDTRYNDSIAFCNIATTSISGVIDVEGQNPRALASGAGGSQLAGDRGPFELPTNVQVGFNGVGASDPFALAVIELRNNTETAPPIG